jgi:hypothetical protein
MNCSLWGIGADRKKNIPCVSCKEKAMKIYFLCNIVYDWAIIYCFSPAQEFFTIHIFAYIFALRGDPRRKSLCATPLKFNYVIKGCLKLILMPKNYRVGFINKEWWPPEETPLWRLKSAYNRHFEIFYNVEKTLLNTTWNRFWFENLRWYYTWDIVR